VPRCSILSPKSLRDLGVKRAGRSAPYINAQAAGRRGMWYFNTVEAASIFLLYRAVKNYIIGDTKGEVIPCHKD